jgi:magnesium transporter
VIRTILTAERHGVNWIDVTAPTPEELHQIAHRHGLHPTVVEDCLDPAHLPKYEKQEEATFVILRVWGERPERTGEAVQDLSRKIALFTRGDLLLTIHRADLAVIQRVEKEWTTRKYEGGDRATVPAIFADIATEALSSYDRPLDDAEETLMAFERALFDPKARPPALFAIHQLKGKLGLIRRMLWLTSGVILKSGGGQERTTPLHQDLRETADSYLFYTDQLLDQTHDLLTIHLAVASHRTNEAIRVLTVFSAFFLPLTFIVGLYGMNFVHMPELSWRLGYPLVLVVMLGVTLAIFAWFRRRGWLRRVGEEEEKL